MAKRTKKDATEVYLEGLLKHLSPEDGALIKEKLLKPEIIDYTGEHILLRDDYSRAMDEATAVRTAAEQERAALSQHNTEATKWYQDNLKALADGSAAMQKLQALEKSGVRVGDSITPPVGDGTTPQPPNLDGLVRKEDLPAAMANLYANTMQQGAQFLTALNRISFEHYKNFNEPLDTGALHEFGIKIKAPTLEAAYHEFAKDKLTDLEKRKEESRIADLTKEIRAKLVKEMGTSGMPYEVNNAEPMAAALSAMKAGNGPDPTNALAAAVEEFNAGRWKA